MGHPEDTHYYIVRTTSNIDGTPIEDIGANHPNNPFGDQGAKSLDGLAICLDAKLEMTWEELYATEPRLEEFVFSAGDIPSYLSLGCENNSFAQANAIVKKVEWRGELNHGN